MRILPHDHFTIAGRTIAAGIEIELDDDLARRAIAAGYAVRVLADPAPSPAPALPDIHPDAGE